MININQLILAGGGFKGVAYIGMLKYLEEHKSDKNIKIIAGTSIGAFVATLICMGYNSNELESVIIHFDYKNYHSIDINFLFDKFGLDSSEKINKFFELLFLSKKYPSDITFNQLYEKTQIHLIMNAVCLNTHESVIFDYLNHPQMPIIKALLASMAIPFLFSCVNYNGLIYSDGGIINNFLIDLPIFQNKSETTLAVNLSQRSNYSIKDIHNLAEYSQQLATCIHNVCQQVATNKQPPIGMHVINLSTPEFGTFDFNLTHDDKRKLINIGYQKTKLYFENFNNKKNFYTPMNNYEILHQLLSNNLIKDALQLIEKHPNYHKKEFPMKEKIKK